MWDDIEVIHITHISVRDNRGTKSLLETLKSMTNVFESFYRCEKNYAITI